MGRPGHSSKKHMYPSEKNQLQSRRERYVHFMRLLHAHNTPDALDKRVALWNGTCTDVGTAARVHVAGAAVHATAAGATPEAVNVSPTGAALLQGGNGALPAMHADCQSRQ